MGFFRLPQTSKRRHKKRERLMSNTERPPSRKTAPTSYLCPKCDQAMRIAFVVPVDPEHERRRFQCALCKESITVVIKYR